MTKENLQEAISGETHEFKSMYPGMKEAAKAEKNDAAFQTFHFANEVEKIHAALYSTALEKLGKMRPWIITSALFAVIR